MRRRQPDAPVDELEDDELRWRAEADLMILSMTAGVSIDRTRIEKDATSGAALHATVLEIYANHGKPYPVDFTA